jgi:hypothetical protein
MFSSDYELLIMNFIKSILMHFILSISNKFEYFCALFQNVQKEIIIIIGGPGTGNLIDGLTQKVLLLS